MKDKPLNLYRRHVKDCSAGHPKGFRSTEGEERRRAWKKCHCPISASGTLKRKFGRRSTGETDWDAARTKAASWQDWDQQSPPPSSPSPSTSPRKSASQIEQAAEAYRAEHESAGSAFRTKQGFATLNNHFKAFCEERGYMLLAQLTDMVIQDFRSSLKVNVNSQNTYMKRLHAFFVYCIARKWITTNPATNLFTIGNRRQRNAIEPERVPFTDAELERIFSACHRYDHINDRPRKWKGVDVAVFINLAIYSGLRISDLCVFDARRLRKDGGLTVRTTKSGKPVDVWLPSWLQDQIRERARIHGPHIFGVSSSSRADQLTKMWWKRCRALFTLCGPWSTAPTPHRLRHTTARILLQKGFTCADVAMVLGNTETVVRKHYAAWVPERQARLTTMFQEAFGSRPAPSNVVRIG